MKRLVSVVLLGTLCSQAHALGHLAEVSLIDRDSGRTLPTYFHRGEYWVAGTPGTRYSIFVRNQTGYVYRPWTARSFLRRQRGF